MQQTVMDSAVSAMNGMISNLERTRVSPAQRSWDDTDSYLQNTPSGEAIETTRLNIKAKASVLRRVTVRSHFVMIVNMSLHQCNLVTAYITNMCQ